jgi:hypothetical protein
VKENIMSHPKKATTPAAAQPEDEEVASSIDTGEPTPDETPSPTQAEMDEARLSLGRAAAYQTRESKPE